MARVRRLIRVCDEGEICAVHRDVPACSVNQAILRLVFPPVPENNIVRSIPRGETIGMLLHPGNIVGMYIPVQISAKTVNRFLTAAVSEKLKIGLGNQKRPDLIFDILVHRDRNGYIFYECPRVS